MPLYPTGWLSRCVALSLFASVACAAELDVRKFGAKGDGTTLDSPAINAAIAAAHKGDTVVFPAGTYLSFSLHLKSNLTLRFAADATLLAATPSAEFGGYDAPEPNEWGDKFQYQDFGHSHWHNSLIWGENLENVAILGPGRIDGTKGLVRNAGFGGRGRGRGGFGPDGPNATSPANNAPPGSAPATSPTPAGPLVGNKAIGLKNCRHVVLRDVSILLAGHFAVLATGVDDLTIENLTVDTNRDGFDIDACRRVRIANCRVNAPNDDAIVLKSSFALGESRACEDVAVTRCSVSGYDPGSLLDGTLKKNQALAPDRDGPTGRIKLGTESNGGFRRIRISDCTFERSRGLALETVDGGPIEDVTIANITMREVTTAPIFIRLGHRARGPEGAKPATIRGIVLRNITVHDADPRYPSLIAGLPDSPVEDVRLSDIHVTHRGGLTLEQVAQQPAALVNTFFLRGAGLTGPRDPFAPPENEKGYPEPSMFGLLPAHGLYVRHAKKLAASDVDIAFLADDARPAIVLDDVTGAEFRHIKAQRAAHAPFFVLRNVRDFTARACAGIADVTRASVENESL